MDTAIPEEIPSPTVAIITRRDADPIVRQAARILRRELSERSGVRFVPRAQAGLRLVLDVRPGIGDEGFEITDGAPGEVLISGNDPRGVLYGAGKWLRTARLGRGGVTPSAWRGRSVPAKPVRGIYFATHFHNFYHDAPLRDVTRYVEELALWGCNALSVWFDMHHFTGMDDPRARAMVRRLRAILLAANRVGMRAALTSLSNEGFSTSPAALRADWTCGHDGYFQEPAGHYHVEICPSRRGGLKQILADRDAMLRAFEGIDLGYYWLWPYDQGGCTCATCAPWGANGHLKASEAVAKLVRKRFPGAKRILSTWYFDHFIHGEWEAFAERINATRPKWFELILADDYGARFPEFILRHGVPGGYPLVTFAEISMYGMSPWGGFGANPLPTHFQNIWNQCGSLVSGGFPYSEGIYEDINKVIQFQFGWDPQQTAIGTVREYAAYEFGPEAADDVVSAVRLMEQGHGHHVDRSALGTSKRPPVYRLRQTEHAEECLALLQRAARRMPPAARSRWRWWRILLLRATLDAQLRRSGGRPTAVTERCFGELTRLYSAHKASNYLAPPTLARLGSAHDKT